MVKFNPVKLETLGRAIFQLLKQVNVCSLGQPLSHFINVLSLEPHRLLHTNYNVKVKRYYVVSFNNFYKKNWNCPKIGIKMAQFWIIFLQKLIIKCEMKRSFLSFSSIVCKRILKFCNLKVPISCQVGWWFKSRWGLV